MDINIIFKILVFLLSIFLISSCISKECKSVRDLDLELQINYTPDRDSFTVGDTLFVKSEFSNMLSDPSKGITETIDDFSFFSIITFQLLNNNLSSIDIDTSQIVFSNVDHQLIDYSNNTFGIGIEKHNFKDEIYNFELQIVLRDTGLYVLYTTSRLGLTNNTSQQRYPGQCSNQQLEAEYKVNNGDAYENNFAIIEGKAPLENLLPHIFVRDGGFAFYVKE